MLDSGSVKYPHILGDMGKHRKKYRDMLSDDEDMISFSFNSYKSSSPMSPMSSPVSPMDWKPTPFKPRNAMQERYVKYLEDATYPIVVATGPAGTSKTFCANAVGIRALLDGTYNKLVITRPIVSVDEQIGFLPETSRRIWILGCDPSMTSFTNTFP